MSPLFTFPLLSLVLGLLLPHVPIASSYSISSSSRTDWLINKITTPVILIEGKDPISGLSTVTLTNGLISRVFATSPAWGTLDFISHLQEEDTSMLRAIRPEASLTLDGLDYNIGALSQSSPTAYINRTEMDLIVNASAWQYVSHATSAPLAPYKFTPGTRHSPSNIEWPPKGLHLTVLFTAPSIAPRYHRALNVSIHYEMYESIPVISKWITIDLYDGEDISGPVGDVLLESTTVEMLATNLPYSPVIFDSYPQTPLGVYDADKSLLFVQTTSPHGTNVVWDIDPSSINNQPGSMQPILDVLYASGPGVHLAHAKGRIVPLFRDRLIGSEEFKKGSTMMHGSDQLIAKWKEPAHLDALVTNAEPLFTSFRTIELVSDSIDPERHGLARRKLMRTLAPSTLSSPLYMHMTNSSSDAFRIAIDQLADIGFDQLIYSFGSSYDVESSNKTYIAEMASDIAYATSKGIEIGAYDLISWTRDVGPAWDQLQGTQPNGNACMASGWIDFLTQRVTGFMAATGLIILETDGPYAGQPCDSKNHTHHYGPSDSIYQQTRLQEEFYRVMRSMNVMINQPDQYFFQGAEKSPMQYNENQFSLPRWQDLTITRQGMYDDTFTSTPTQGWMFLPLEDYHAGGDDAAFAPLSDHIVEYEWALAQLIGHGVPACYRGQRMYDSEATRTMVKKWTKFYSTYRDILVSDIIHIRRPDNDGIDAILHANPSTEHVGLAFVFNPTEHPVSETLAVNLYYTGISVSALVSAEGAPSIPYTLARNYDITLPIKLAPKSFTWFVIDNNDAKVRGNVAITM